MPKTSDRPSTTGSLRSARSPHPALLLGPALVAGIAYLDPGNVATNMSAGAEFAYLLVWVIVLANTAAWLVQYLSAKLGVVSERSLSDHLGTRLKRPFARRAYWVQAELVVMATDIAEVIGGAVALQLLFGLPLLLGGAITGAVSLLLLLLHRTRDIRPFERTMVAMVLIIAIGFCAGLFIAPPDPGAMLAGMVPRFEGTSSLMLAVSILGATIMPHAIYAHSALVRDRFAGAGRPPVRTLLRATRWDVSIAMVLAGAVNLAMLLLAASTLPGVPGTDTLEGAHAALQHSLGPVIATMFAVGLLVSGLASTSVGAYTGAEVMNGLLHVRVPAWQRRLITIVPALVILAIGFDPTQALVLSQVALSFGIPFAVIPLVVLTAQRRTLGAFRNHPITTVAGIGIAALLIVLNVVLIVLVFTGNG